VEALLQLRSIRSLRYPARVRPSSSRLSKIYALHAICASHRPCVRSESSFGALPLRAASREHSHPHVASLCSLRTRKERLPSRLTSLQGALEIELSLHTLDPMGGIDILDQGNLVASRAPLSRDDSAVGQEILPYLSNPSSAQRYSQKQ